MEKERRWKKASEYTGKTQGDLKNLIGINANLFSSKKVGKWQRAVK